MPTPFLSIQNVRGSGLLGFLGNLGGEEDGHVPSVQLGVLVQRGDLAALLGKLEQQALADVGVSHLAAAEADRDLHPVALGQELLGVAELHIEVVYVDTGRHADFLDLHDVLVFPCLLLPLGLLELVLAVVHELTDGGIRGGRDLHQVQIRVHGALQRLPGGHDAQLLSGVGDQANLLVADLFVDLMTLFADTKAPPILRYIQKNGYQSGTRIQPEHARAASGAHGKPD